MAETFSTLSVYAYVVAAVFLVLAVLLFVLLKIPKVFSDYTGRSAKKSINKLRASNESTDNKSYKPSAVNKKRGKITESVQLDSEKGKKTKDKDLPGTGLIKENMAPEYHEEETALLEQRDENTAELKEVKVERKTQVELKMIDEALFVHTDEVIV